MVFATRNSSAFSDQLEPHLSSIWRYAMSLSGRPDVADDLMQATCLRALEKQRQFQPGGSLIAWLLTICRSIWLNELRSAAVRKTGSLDTATQAELQSNALGAEMNIFVSEVFTKIMALPEAQREACCLVYVQNFTYREAAGILGVPIGTIMSRLASTRAKLAPLNDADASTRSDAP